LFGDLWNRLNRRRAGTDAADAQTGEVNAFVRPEASVIPAAFEGIQAFEIRSVGGRQAADGHDAVAGGIPLAVVGLDVPTVGGFVVVGVRDASVELDVAAQVETVGDVVEVAQDFGLGRVALGPFPLLPELRRAGVGAVEALDVAA